MKPTEGYVKPALGILSRARHNIYRRLEKSAYLLNKVGLFCTLRMVGSQSEGNLFAALSNTNPV